MPYPWRPGRTVSQVVQPCAGWILAILSVVCAVGFRLYQAMASLGPDLGLRHPI